MKKEKDVVKNKKQPYAFYSLLLNEPFESVADLELAEEAYYAKQRAKEEKAATRKADAVKVEEAFKALNTARKDYKEQLLLVTENYTKELKALKAAFEESKDLVEKRLAYAETKYSEALKEFNEKYPEGYHITLKDGDFETTLCKEVKDENNLLNNPLCDIFNLFFNI